MSDELAALDACGQAELVRKGEVSPAELVDAAIERAERLDPQLNAIILPRYEQAREVARSGQLADGPFRGVPYVMKDCGGGEQGEAHHYGMRALKNADYREPVQSHYAESVAAAGLVPIGRSNTPELAILPTSEPLAYGPTRNPWSLDHSAGGSSGGSAAAVAAGIVSAAHASDGGGSIRGPASKCGLVGLKPTRGRCSFGPAVSERWCGLSAELSVTRSVRDAAALLDVFAGPRPGDPYAAPTPARPFREEVGADPGRLRIAWMDDAPRDLELHPEPRAAVSKAASLLEELGHEVVLDHPPALQDPTVVATFVGIVSASTARMVDAAGERIGRSLDPHEDIEPLTRALAERGRNMSAAEHLANLEFVHGFGRKLAHWWDEGSWDLLLTPTLGQPPAEVGWLTSTDEEPFRAYVRAGPYGVFTLPYNMSGQPAISLPLHMSEGQPSLPVGVQLVAPFGREDLLLRVASQLEEAHPWQGRRPPIFA